MQEQILILSLMGAGLLLILIRKKTKDGPNKQLAGKRFRTASWIDQQFGLCYDALVFLNDNQVRVEKRGNVSNLIAEGVVLRWEALGDDGHEIFIHYYEPKQRKSRRVRCRLLKDSLVFMDKKSGNRIYQRY